MGHGHLSKYDKTQPAVANPSPKGPLNLDYITEENPGYGTIQQRLISQPRVESSTFKSKTKRFKEPEPASRSTYYYKDEWAQSIHTRAESKVIIHPNA